jgi:4-hydroxymandelate synthase
MADAFEGSTVNHVEFYVEDAAKSAGELADRFGFETFSGEGSSQPDAEVRSFAVGGDQIKLLMTEGRSSSHPASAYVRRHGAGVADIALRVADAAKAFDEAVRRGARPIAAPAVRDGAVVATIGGFGDVVHSLVELDESVDPRSLLGWAPRQVRAAGSGPDLGLIEIDHFAVCVEAGQLDQTVRYYEDVLGFEMIFAERIAVGSSGMDSKVVQSASGAVTLTIIEPDTDRKPGQIDRFLAAHDGAGVQHIAFRTDDIVTSVAGLTANGVGFLDAPGTYYDLLPSRLELTRHSISDLRPLGLLVDEDHDGQLFQIFARSTHARETFFFEVVERLGARTFGSGNIKALYEAVALAQAGTVAP